MKLSKIRIQNYRKLHDVEVDLGDATFLIGANNSGKTSTLSAIEYLLTGKKLEPDCRSKYVDVDGNEQVCQDDIIFEGTFVDVKPEILNERGFNADRLTKVKDNDGNVTYSFVYRVRFSNDGKPHREMLMHKEKLKSVYEGCEKPQDFIDKGANADLFAGKELTKKFSAAEKKTFEDVYPSLYELEPDIDWFENPGGIPGNVLSKLPRFLKIEADVLSEEMDASKSSTLHDLLQYIFEDIRKDSEHYQKAVTELTALAKEMDPDDENSAFGQLMKDMNKVVDDVFPKATINVETDLANADTLRPKFGVTMSSNVTTDVLHQGTGLIRSAVFALLRFDKRRREHIGEVDPRGLVIGFEEPELFLHPNAAENMRRVIYELAEKNSQIVATTHSPYMIDLSKKPRQVLNSYSITANEFTNVAAFNLTDAFQSIQDDDRTRVKMIQKIDDYVSRVFFAQKVVIVEGDTEDVVFKKTISVMPEDVKKEIGAKYQIIKATGKATMISFVKYLKALNVDAFVVHDEDSGTPGAVKMNAPILNALDNDASKRLMMHNCIEDELGYDAPSSDKPYKAYRFVENWKSWADVPQNWKDRMKNVFPEFATNL